MSNIVNLLTARTEAVQKELVALQNERRVQTFIPTLVPHYLETTQHALFVAGNLLLTMAQLEAVPVTIPPTQYRQITGRYLAGNSTAHDIQALHRELISNNALVKQIQETEIPQEQ